jgi:heme exporter protein D
MIEFLAMKGYGFYIWMSYGVTAIVLVAEIVALRARRRAVLAEAQVVSGEEGSPLGARTAPAVPPSRRGAR